MFSSRSSATSAVRRWHFSKDRNAKAREAITALTAEVAELREENKKLLDQLVAAGSQNDELAQAPQAQQAVTP